MSARPRKTTGKVGRWAAAEERYLREWFGLVDMFVIAETMGRDWMSVAMKAQQMKLKRKPAAKAAR